MRGAMMRKPGDDEMRRERKKRKSNGNLCLVNNKDNEAVRFKANANFFPNQPVLAIP